MGFLPFGGEHFSRLVRSAGEIRLACSLEQSGFHRLLISGLQQSGYQESKIYIQMTRGVAPREHIFPSKGTYRLFIISEDGSPCRRKYANGV